MGRIIPYILILMQMDDVIGIFGAYENIMIGAGMIKEAYRAV